MKSETDKLHLQSKLRNVGDTLKQGASFTRLVCVSTVMSAVLAGCGGGIEMGGSSSSANGVSSSSKPPVSSSKASVSSSKSSVSSSKSSVSSVASVSSVSSVGGNIASGKAILQGADCVDCHNATATPGVFTKLNPNSLNFATSTRYPGYGPLTESNLAKFISATMPQGSVGLCDAKCGQDVAAYIWSLRGGSSSSVSSSSSGSVTCTGNNPVLYGQRGAKVLASYEYQNSLQALFKQPLEKDYGAELVDDNIDKIPSQRKTSINASALGKYDTNAAAIAAWAMKTPGALPFSCSDYKTESCANLFVDKFATMAYRRPLTAAEKTEYKNMILNGFTPDKGVEWAIRTVLSSAAFLYRTENGVLVSDVRTKGWGTAPANFGGAVDLGAGVKIQAENFSAMEGVQLEATMDTGGGQNVGYIDSGDWLDYDVSVPKAATYAFVFRVAAMNATGSFVVQAKGADVATITVPSTGGYQNWQDVKRDIALPAGEYTLRIKSTGAGYNLNWITVGTPPADMPSLVDVFRVQSEAYTAQQGVQLETTMDQGGGQNVGYIDANDTMDYSVEVPTAGEYEVAYRVASMNGGGSLSLEVAGKSQGTVTVPTTGGWQNWQTVKGKATLPAGKTTVRFKAITGGFNINWMEFGRLPAAVTPIVPMDAFPKLTQADPAAYVLDPYEYASALAYMYTAAPPDIALLRAAAKGDLEKPETVDAHIKRMMDSPLGREQMLRFADKYLKTATVTQSMPEHASFTAGVKTSMAQEVRELFNHVFYTPSVPVTELFSANYTFLDSTLSSFYKIPGGGAMPGQFVKVPTMDRGGVLTTGAFLAKDSKADETHPIKRSVHVREDILCQLPPPIPVIGEAGSDREVHEARVNALLPLGTLTITDKFDLQTRAPECATCHEAIINPLFGMDDFDYIGLPRKKVNGLVVQKGLGASGKEDVPIDWVNKDMAAVYGINDIDQADKEKLNGQGLRFSGVKDLSNKLAGQPAVTNCFMQRSYRFATGYSLFPQVNTRNVERIGDRLYTAQQNTHMACQSEDLAKKFEASGKSAYEFYRSIGLGDVVRFRKD